ncbi:type VII secretion protein EccCa [Mycobacterium sp. SM1]|uniref:type VII secretion protein EccCa n=1 Tax=Mycobacterium sp. SM1 TaxID=2816243 RepID=UPI001BCF71AE|nr:type VII secretion protein EccCa [Mycobacterium sp. SM1]MBS4728894.1 type VII secretion protein EccCa [Mycobacterium sp. SM1]
MTHRDRDAATAGFTPAPRRAPPAFATTEIAVALPPALPRSSRSGLPLRLLPVITALGAAVMTTTVWRAGPAAAHSPMFVVFPAMMLVSVAVTVAAGRAGGRGGEIAANRADYLDYLSGLRDSVAATAAAQRSSLSWCHPDPGSLWTVIGGCRMWERRDSDPDFCQVRVGVGTRPLATPLVPPKPGPGHRADPVTAAALRRFIDTHSAITQAPLTIALSELAVVTVDGDPALARGLLRAMLCELAVLHPPDRLLIIGVIGDCARGHWDWLKWLPHNQHPHVTDAVGATRMSYASAAEADAALRHLRLSRPPGAALPHVVALVDGVRVGDRLTAGGIADLTVLQVGSGCGPAVAAGLRLCVAPEKLVVGRDGEATARPDRMDLVDALVCARRLAGYRLAGPSVDSARQAVRWQDLLGIDDVAAFDPTTLWRNGNHGDRLRVPIGTTVAGTVLELDIKEPAENGVGPHGLCIGATGSGKSEFLRTVALGMMARNPPDVLNLVLVDFKGGATFLGLDGAPHVAAVITNLCDEAPLVARMRDALTGEMNRRQQLLRAAGSFVSVTAYTQARGTDARLAALPALLIIVDEFSELLSQHPDFADVFVAIGRLGRSLGMHLLLASQRLDEGRLRGLESHLSYRVCLKTLSANESRIVLGTQDAYQLPSTPGAAVLRTATAELIPFQGAFVSGPCPASSAPPHGAQRASSVYRFTAAPAGRVRPGSPARTGGRKTPARTVLQAVVEQLAGHGPPAREVWLPPLGAAPALDSVLRDAASVTGGLGPDRLAVPIGIVDCPFEQRRAPLIVDLSGVAGNVAVVGAPRSGKSTTLRTLITALAATHDPDRVQFYCLDFGGGTLAWTRAVPHVGSVASRAEPQLARRMIAELESVVREREAELRERGVDVSTRDCPQPAGHTAAGRRADVFLVIDGWAGLCREFDTLEGPITALAAQGLSFGVHVVLSATRWAEIRPALKDQLGTRIELRLGDPADSELDRKQAQLVPLDRPGRGLSREGRHMVIALPRLDGVSSEAGLAEAGARAGELLRRRHGTSGAPPIPLLPAQVDRHGLVERAGEGLRSHILLGVEDRRLRPVPLDFARWPHLLILGENECGKTSALRLLCREIARTTTAAHAQLLLVDFRRTLLGVVESDHLAGYAMSAPALGALLPDLIGLLRRRLPPPNATQAQLRAASCRSGPSVYVVVDDYDLVAMSAANPLLPLVEYLPYARDLGLHLVVARRSGGAARALFEPLLASLRDLGCQGLIMSGSPEEGPLIGSVGAVPLPPGRGILITGDGDEQVVQVAWSPPP